MNVLVDTSVWSLALRRTGHSLNRNEEQIVAEFSELIREGRAQIVGLVRQELLSGLRTQEQFERLRQYLRAFPDERLNTSDHEEAARLGNQCRAKGMAVSVVDILLCAVAAAREWSIFTIDPDFSRYAKVFPLNLHTPRT